MGLEVRVSVTVASSVLARRGNVALTGGIVSGMSLSSQVRVPSHCGSAVESVISEVSVLARLTVMSPPPDRTVTSVRTSSTCPWCAVTRWGSSSKTVIGRVVLTPSKFAPLALRVAVARRADPGLLMASSLQSRTSGSGPGVVNVSVLLAGVRTSATVVSSTLTATVTVPDGCGPPRLTLTVPEV